jgi:hypothetical protein
VGHDAQDGQLLVRDRREGLDPGERRHRVVGEQQRDHVNRDPVVHHRNADLASRSVRTESPSRTAGMETPRAAARSAVTPYETRKERPATTGSPSWWFR